MKLTTNFFVFIDMKLYILLMLYYLCNQHNLTIEIKIVVLICLLPITAGIVVILRYNPVTKSFLGITPKETPCPGLTGEELTACKKAIKNKNKNKNANCDKKPEGKKRDKCEAAKAAAEIAQAECELLGDEGDKKGMKKCLKGLKKKGKPTKKPKTTTQYYYPYSSNTVL